MQTTWSRPRSANHCGRLITVTQGLEARMHGDGQLLAQMLGGESGGFHSLNDVAKGS